MLLKIGELAKRAGLSVRALHHYDRIGLLSPSVRTPSGARRYGREDVIRLHRIQALKHLGYALSDILKNLDGHDASPLEIIARQRQTLEEKARQALELSARLGHLAEHLARDKHATTNDWLDLLEMMTLYDKHLTPSEMVALRQARGKNAGELATEWTALITEVGLAMTQQLSEDSATAQEMAWRWMRLAIAMTDNNPTLANKLKALHEHEPRAQEIMGIDPAKLDWIGRAFAHARASLLARHLNSTEVAEVLRRQLANMAHMEAWPRLVAQVRAQMETGVAASAEPMQALARQWQQLFRESYCGDDPVLESRVRAAFMAEPDLMLGVGVDEALIAYIQRAMAHLYRPHHQSANPGPKPSAKNVAIYRAVHQLLDHPRVLDDPYALRIIGETDAAMITRDATKYQDPISRALRAALVVRSRVADDALAEAFAQGVRQCVILGAGLDTTAYRGKLPGLRFFEVDLPETQQWKRDCLREAGMETPASLCFAPVDFETATLAEGLATAGLNPDQPAFFIWLGVTMYLEEAAILNTLRYIARCASGSSVVFDYLLDAESLAPDKRISMQAMAEYVAERGEPWKSHFAPPAFAAKLHALGYATVRDDTPATLNRRYLADRSDGLQIGGFARVVLAQC